MLFTYEEDRNPRVVYAQKRMRVPLALTAISEVIIAMYTVSDFEPMPEGLRGTLNGFSVFSAIYLSGIAYGMLNDVFACWNNVKYFTEGHNQGQEKGLVKTDDFLANAVIWGMLATWWLSLPAGLLFGLSAGISYAAGAPFAPFLMAIIPIISIIVAVGADISSRVFQNKLMAQGYNRDYATWQGNNHRNSFGYKVLPATACAGLIVMTIINALIGANIISVPDVLMSNEMQAAAYSLPAAIVALGLLYFFSKCAYLSAFPQYQSEQFTRNYPEAIREAAAERQAIVRAGSNRHSFTVNIGAASNPPEQGQRVQDASESSELARAEDQAAPPLPTASPV